MIPELILASAGAGKSALIAAKAHEQSAAMHSVLILTYTENNQKEILRKVCKIDGYKPQNITIKGWFTFLLEDMIRPYQNCIFKERINGIIFNDNNPHIKNGKNIPGTGEKVNGKYNPKHYLNKLGDKAHTINLAKLASRIVKESHNKPIQRLTEIYSGIFIDEVQDLVGYDFDVIKAISKSNCNKFVCVGDFRQTIYRTSIGLKSPKLSSEKLDAFKKIGFQDENLNISWRCIQPICDIADRIHAAEKIYLPTNSQVKEIPKDFPDHLGVFTVSSKQVLNYIERFSPVILKLDRSTQIEICRNRLSFNFGLAKGLGFNRVLIFPTNKHKDFLSGNDSVFNKDKTDKAKNTFYVAITRGKFSVAFVYDGQELCAGVNRWSPN